MEKKLQKPCPADFNLLTEQDLWQAHYKILLRFSLKKFIKLNLKIDITIKNVKPAKLNTKFVTDFMNIQTLKMT